MNRGEYRQIPDRDVWHFHPKCQHWRRTKFYTDSKNQRWPDVKTRSSKPTTGELCNECLRKEKRDRQ